MYDIPKLHYGGLTHAQCATQLTISNKPDYSRAAHTSPWVILLKKISLSHSYTTMQQLCSEPEAAINTLMHTLQQDKRAHTTAFFYAYQVYNNHSKQAITMDHRGLMLKQKKKSIM